MNRFFNDIQYFLLFFQRECIDSTESEPFNPPQHTSALLNQILNPEKDIDEQDIINWGHYLVAGGQSFQDFANKGMFLKWPRNCHTSLVIFRIIFFFEL